jgi:hypothetical protein
MSEAKHTPGPWAATRDPAAGQDGLVLSDVERGRVLGHVFVGNKEREANARLIAASPDLLDAHEKDAEAMQRIAREMEQGRFVAGSPGHALWAVMAFRKAAVISKARGSQ